MLTEILMTSLMFTSPHLKTDSVINIKEVTVTEFKTNRRSLAPMSVNKMNTRDLDMQNVTSMKELSTLIPNFYMPDYGSRANSPIFIRGIGSKAKTSAVGFYIDGIPHYDISSLLDEYRLRWAKQNSECVLFCFSTRFHYLCHRINRY